MKLITIEALISILNDMETAYSMEAYCTYDSLHMATINAKRDLCKDLISGLHALDRNKDDARDEDE